MTPPPPRSAQCLKIEHFWHSALLPFISATHENRGTVPKYRLLQTCRCLWQTVPAPNFCSGPGVFQGAAVSLELQSSRALGHVPSRVLFLEPQEHPSRWRGSACVPSRTDPSLCHRQWGNLRSPPALAATAGGRQLRCQSSSEIASLSELLRGRERNTLSGWEWSTGRVSRWTRQIRELRYPQITN